VKKSRGSARGFFIERAILAIQSRSPERGILVFSRDAVMAFSRFQFSALSWKMFSVRKHRLTISIKEDPNLIEEMKPLLNLLA
jgi:hypothetical protein